jgi:rubrerythrin
MGRNTYLRMDVGCCECGWMGTRKSNDKPCPKCGAGLRVLSQKGGRHL